MMAVYTSGPLKSLALVVLSILARLSMADAADDCVPNIGTSGPLMSVTLVVRTWEQRSSNFHVSVEKLRMGKNCFSCNNLD